MERRKPDRGGDQAPLPLLPRRRLGAAAACVVVLAAAIPLAGAQETAPALPGLAGMIEDDPDARMLLEANELIYDFDRDVVSAEGDVEIYYRGYTLESDRVIYDQATRRVFARGNVRIVEPDGAVMYADSVELTDDFREGFVEQLTVITTEDARFAAISAERVDDNLTIFTQGVYTACEPCEDSRRAPMWQVKAARIIHDQQERVIYYENASLEVLGVPIAYMPFFRHPDPTVDRQSGFLPPAISYDDRLGASVRVPYFFALAPNYDLTVAATGFTKQGGMGDFQWRHRLTRGTYTIEGAAIRQNQPLEFQRQPDLFLEGDRDRSPGNREFRGFLRTAGIFQINDFWQWGFDGRLTSDTLFMRHYRFTSDREYRNQVFLTGQSARNWFDGRVMDYRSLVREDEDAVLPTVHPIIDHNYIFGRDVLGGRLSLDTNMLSLTRDEADFANIRPRLNNEFNCAGAWSQSDPIGDEDLEAALAHCDLIGAPGNYNRFVTKATWETTFVDNMGQVFKPFAWMRGDLYALDIDDPFLDRTSGAPVVGHFVETGSHTVARGMPAVGMEYRWPFLFTSSWGYQVLEPTAQIIARPNETHAAELPNEDAQSLIFDDTILFAHDKFSGYDRIEGGTRANYGVRYNLQAHNGMAGGAMFGQSYHIAGDNPFPVGSGLETTRSDYVTSAHFSPVPNVQLATRLRLDQANFSLRRHDLEARGHYGPVRATARYSEISADPDVGVDFDRREVSASASYQIDDNWRIFGSGRLQLAGGQLDDHTSSGRQWISNAIGIGYSDECITLALSYQRRYVRDGDDEPDQRIMFRFNLRTVTEGEVSTRIDSRGGLLDN